MVPLCGSPRLGRSKQEALDLTQGLWGPIVDQGCPQSFSVYPSCRWHVALQPLWAPVWTSLARPQSLS